MRELRRAQQDSEAFLEIYHAGSLDEAYSAAKDLDRSPLAAVFLSAYNELRRLARTGGGPVTLTEPHLVMLARNVSWSSSREGLRLERGLSFLATTGSAAPFIGLFGTVWGILVSFRSFASLEQVTIKTVGPDIAEALLATAFGLAAAIPAVMAYNYFVRRIRVQMSAMESFEHDYLNIIRRHFLK
jgi:biopolymer transport protein TolQ